MFVQILLLRFLLFEMPLTSASRYSAFCNVDSDCDQYQKCTSNTCRCNRDQRRFWTGKICAICSQGFTSTFDRCYQAFDDLKTWSDARAFCRSRYADLFTWRDNTDEQFIRPLVDSWWQSNTFASAQSSIFSTMKVAASAMTNYPIAAVWSGAIINSFDPFTVKWTDRAGMNMYVTSAVWCDPTSHADYGLSKQPSLEIRQNGSRTEREECVTFIFGGKGSSLLCLADEFCSKKLPYICEMNTASMELANSQQNDINFEASLPTPSDLSPTIPKGDNSFSKKPDTAWQGTSVPSALAGDADGLSMTQIVAFLGIGILLIGGAIAGYMFIKKRKETPEESAMSVEEASVETGGPSSTISLGGLAEDDETQSIQSLQ